MINKIFYQLYNPTGMINQVMSVELAVGIAHESNSEMIIHYVSNNGDELYHFKKVPIYTPSRWTNNQRSEFINNDHFPHITDILDFNKDMVLIDEKINKFPQESSVIDGLAFNYYWSKDGAVTEDELHFAEGRSRLVLNNNIHLKNTLGWYSRFFYNRSKELDLALSSVDFKKEYYDFANEICSSIGEFQGIHLRLSDHTKMFNTTQEMFESSLNILEKNNLPIVLSTDEPLHKMVVKNKHRVLMLDEYIVNNFRNQFKSLKFQDEVIFGLICNLVMHKSKKFIGTSGSTYTAYIHRKRLQAGLEENFDFLDMPNKASLGPYSWNGYDLDTGKKMWWREWKESKLLC